MAHDSYLRLMGSLRPGDVPQVGNKTAALDGFARL